VRPQVSVAFSGEVFARVKLAAACMSELLATNTSLYHCTLVVQQQAVAPTALFMGLLRINPYSASHIYILLCITCHFLAGAGESLLAVWVWVCCKEL
jgi:hypothetical protein